jgi:hypothetical protein
MTKLCYSLPAIFPFHRAFSGQRLTVEISGFFQRRLVSPQLNEQQDQLIMLHNTIKMALKKKQQQQQQQQQQKASNLFVL